MLDVPLFHLFQECLEGPCLLSPPVERQPCVKDKQTDCSATDKMSEESLYLISLWAFITLLPSYPRASLSEWQKDRKPINKSYM